MNLSIYNIPKYDQNLILLTAKIYREEFYPTNASGF